jgi:hypothetical protein
VLFGSDFSAGAAMLANALQQKNFAIIYDWFATCFLWGAVGGLLLAGLAAWANTTFYDGLRIFALSVIFASASTVCGWLLGLLFGIPRTLSRPQAVGNSSPPPSGSASQGGAANPSQPNRVNTNLEDVSDWLTKTLVGVGLTQLYLMPHYLWSTAEKLNSHGFKWDTHGQLLALALFLYFAPGGFWLGYIGTRTALTKLFDSLEGGPSAAQIELALKPTELQVDTKGQITPPASIEVKAADAALLSVPITALNTPRDLGAWGAAQARASKLDSAAVALEQAAKADPTEPVFKEALAKVYMAQDRKDDAQQILRTAPPTEIAVLNALYENPPGGFTKAIEIGNKLKDNRATARSFNLHVWLACAYGQQHRYAGQQNNDALKTSALQNVIQEVKVALEIDPVAAKPLLYSVWKPAAGSPDNDLSSIPADNPDLKRLLE